MKNALSMIGSALFTRSQKRFSDLPLAGRFLPQRQSAKGKCGGGREEDAHLGGVRQNRGHDVLHSGNLRRRPPAYNRITDHSRYRSGDMFDRHHSCNRRAAPMQTRFEVVASTHPLSAHWSMSERKWAKASDQAKSP